MPCRSGGGTYGDRGDVTTAWLTGETIMAKDGERVWIGRAGCVGGEMGVVDTDVSIGRTRLFEDGPEDDIREDSSQEGDSSGCLRFLDGGWG